MEFPAQLQGAKAAEAVLEVALDQDCCGMWSNTSVNDVELVFAVQRLPKGLR